ncbi:hypothetical protein ACODT5_13075 [Streptomyces sp. 5.8]|uniref:hypothetical protein n=1 Tax=Streptomyces sp. 5.8 TaxID=3406571 RepID=UPI003BB56B05
MPSKITSADVERVIIKALAEGPKKAPHWSTRIRVGAAALLWALAVATGQVIRSVHHRHRAAEFKRFLTKVDKEVPADLQIHLTTKAMRPAGRRT